MTKHHNMLSPNGALSDKTILYKASDQTVNNSTTLVDDNDLFFSIGAGETWLFLASLFVQSASATPDIDCLWDNQDGLTGSIKAASRAGGSDNDYTDDFTTEKTIAVTASIRNAIIDGCVTATAGGTLKLKWAQNTATAEDTKILACSFIRAERIA